MLLTAKDYRCFNRASSLTVFGYLLPHFRRSVGLYKKLGFLGDPGGIRGMEMMHSVVS
jgi:hypothetical protein